VIRSADIPVRFFGKTKPKAGGVKEQPRIRPGASKVLRVNPFTGIPIYMTTQEALLALNMIENVGPVRVRQLLDYFSEAPAILSASKDQLLRVKGVGAETAEAIHQWESTVDLLGELRRISEFGCHLLTASDEGYPPLLKQIYDPPMVLYVKGKLLEKDRNAIALVGSRMTTHYGIEIARKLAYQLAYVGVTVVSGGARGIDTAAHQGALNAQGRTVVVLGTGINLVFPSENAALFERVTQSGAVITQFPFNRPADKQSFPIRNRIVAGMTLGTAVVEANLTSGALITANMAADYGRQVFAVPGRIDSPRSKGCHDLIKRGAKLCEGVEDILSEFEYLFPTSRPLSETVQAAQFGTMSLSDVERQVYEAIGPEETSIDEIIRKCGLSVSTVSVTLLALEMKRLIRQLPGKVYRWNT
jgi:DNA processing protein